MKVSFVKVSQGTAFLAAAIQQAADEYGRLKPEEYRKYREEMEAVFEVVLDAAHEKSIMAILLGAAAALFHVLEETC